MSKNKPDFAKDLQKDHTRKKLEIIGTYVYNYLIARCTKLPYDSFKIVIVDGFSNTGINSYGQEGSAIVILNQVKLVFNEIQVIRKAKGFSELKLDCTFIFNDKDENAAKDLENNFKINNMEQIQNLNIKSYYFVNEFEEFYKTKKDWIKTLGNSFLFIIDPYGWKQVKRKTFLDILKFYPSVEIFYTFMIGSFLTFISKDDIKAINDAFNFFGISVTETHELEQYKDKAEWLAAVGRIVFQHFYQLSTTEMTIFSTPFFIDIDKGYDYILMHFTKKFIGRDVYLKTLYENVGFQCLQGKIGMDVFSYKSKDDSKFFAFKEHDRELTRDRIKNELPEVIHNFLINSNEDRLLINNLKNMTLNKMAAHPDDFRNIIGDNQELEIITSNGRKRRSTKGIKDTDIITLGTRKLIYLPLTKKK